MIPYGRQQIDYLDIESVVETLQSDFLTTGPVISKFEETVATYCKAKYATALSSGTSALHASMHALNIQPGDEVIVPPMTFAATANCILYMGGKPVFADVEEDTLLLNPSAVYEKISSRTRAIIGVDYAGQPCDWDSLRKIAHERGIKLVADSCHALGAEYKEQRVGTLADLTVLSFHPVKHITTGEGGMVLTEDKELYARIMRFRAHGINSTPEDRDKNKTWYYEMVDLGYNYRITDIQCALGVSQMKKLNEFLRLRRQIAKAYENFFDKFNAAKPLKVHSYATHSYHLYVIRVDPNKREKIFIHLRKSGIGVNVHYIPVYLHPYYRNNLGYSPGICPVAEKVYAEIISLPIWPGLKPEQISTILAELEKSV